MTDTISQYFEFLRFCLDEQPLAIDIEKINWEGLYQFTFQQAISAVVFGGIERMWNNDAKIPKGLLLRWIGDVEMIKHRNQLVNKRCAELVNQLHKDGYECCVLKGQGNASMYPNPYTRTPGDIDVWVKPMRGYTVSYNAYIGRIISYAKSHNPKGNANIIHADYGEWGGVEVELHYWPTYMNSPVYNRRLCNWVRHHGEKVFNNKKVLPGVEGEINVPTVEFNIVYQLSHMYKHVFAEGIGLRQVIDYYYLLKLDNKFSKSEIVSTLQYLGLYNFASAVMYVLYHVLGLEEEKLIVPIDERRGKFLIEEILRGGNFGKYDTKGFLVKWNNSVGSLLRHLERDIRLVRYFPSESFWEPISRIYQHFWRLKHK